MQLSVLQPSPPTISQHPPQTVHGPPRPSPQAPVANMMGGSSTTARKTSFSKPPSFSQPQPSPTVPPQTPPGRPPSVGACDPIVAKYPYYLAAHKLRPKVYQSPYACEGGFTTAYLPNTAVPKPEHTRNRSLSEDFLLKRSLSQQELLKTHRRLESESKPSKPPQPDQIYSSLYRPSSATNQPPTMLMGGATTTTTAQPPPHQQASYFPPQQYQHDPSPPFYNNPLYQSPPSLYDQQASPIQQHHPTTTAGGGGLQFQSPHDFQMQMQREAQHHEWSKPPGGFDQFFKGLHKASANTNGGNDGDGGGGGGGVGTGGVGIGVGISGGSSGGSGTSTQGSPLKYEMGGGGEMLPMMGDRFS